MRAEQRRRERRRNILFGATIAVAALAVLGGVGLSLVFRGGAGIPGVQSFSRLARTHVARAVSYPQRPPVGGPHSPVWLNCGIYTAPVSSVSAVHSLEHGRVGHLPS